MPYVEQKRIPVATTLSQEYTMSRFYPTCVTHTFNSSVYVVRGAATICMRAEIKVPGGV